ncbi:heavy metal translocating P-type ATPase [Paludicola sp. MB14-C6]|uniref:heavy metal translocating P-type ATPase n=1 Tax=Paludihabitans sp. MB14-C6 TaxID=3070656 RepID=UPI0027DDDCC0|nr:heavy metal translocating P-type ATPase [Paludicola sp. MB14-C6]WMJ23837.1 heavy metal translocating P-type ATPase [Paludicola sp. MB14-C6]
MKRKFNIQGMTCSACSAHIEKNISKLQGVKNVQVNLLSNNMVVEYEENQLNDQAIVKAVGDAGYGASIPNIKQQSTAKPQDTIQGELKSMKVRLIISIIFLIPLFYISMGHMIGLPLPSILAGHKNALSFAFTQFLLSLPIIYVNFKYFKTGFKTLFKGQPNMDSLIAIGCTAAMSYGIYAIFKIGYGFGHGNMDLVHRYSMDLYFESAAMILALITLGKYLETRAKGKTSDAISKLLDLTPKTALVIRNEQEIEVATEDLVIGDIIIVKPGQSVPVDGILIEGSSSIDESALTGESIPVAKQINDKVTGASINKTGFFKMKATQVGDDTTLAQIIRLVEEAGSSKAPIAKLADKVSAIFVPTVIAIALLATTVWLLLGYSIEFAISIGIAVLVISCPCALGLATPTAIMVGTGKGAQNGILIKSAESLEILHSIDTVVLDKTGTITEGKPIVTDLFVYNNILQHELLTIAASLESSSEHPLASAIMDKAKEENISFRPVLNFISITGKGIKGEIDGITYLAGNQKLLEKHKIDFSPYEEITNTLTTDGKTPLFFADTQKLLGIIAVMDTVKPTSKQAIEEFVAMGIETVMLTGDNKQTAKAIQNVVGIQTVIAEVMPQEKEKHVRLIMEQGKKVAMIGDGINDSPALARADVGIAIGAGTDIAIESADVVLMKSDLLDAVSAIQLSKSTLRNIKQNLFWALIYNTLGIPIAAGVFYVLLGWKLNPMFAAAAMSLSSVCVVSNALRLKLFKPKFHHVIQSKSITNENKGDFKMTKSIIINGMSCGHCSARVEAVLNAIDGVSCTVNLETKTASVTLTKEVADDVLTRAITDAGYEVESIA